MSKSANKQTNATDQLSSSMRGGEPSTIMAQLVRKELERVLIKSTDYSNVHGAVTRAVQVARGMDAVSARRRTAECDCPLA